MFSELMGSTCFELCARGWFAWRLSLLQGCSMPVLKVRSACRRASRGVLVDIDGETEGALCAASGMTIHRGAVGAQIVLLRRFRPHAVSKPVFLRACAMSFSVP